MQIGSMASLWFALSLPLIVLLYMLKRTYVDTTVSSSLLWRRVLREQEANRPWQRLRRQLLLLLQLLAAALLVLALMEPYVDAAGGVTEDPAVLVLDASASMSGADGESVEAGSYFAAAKLAMKEWLDLQPADKPVTLIKAGAEPEIIAAGGQERGLSADLINGLELEFGSADLQASLSLADAVLRDEPKGSILLFTDRTGNQMAAETVHPLSIISMKGSTEADSFTNTAIAGFGIQPESSVNQSDQTGLVTIINYGDRPASGRWHIYTSDTSRPVHTEPFTLQAGKRHSYKAADLPKADYYKAVLDIEDSYKLDNTAYGFPVSSGLPRALLVSSGNLFLEKALRLAGVQVVLADPQRYEPDGSTAASIDWIVIDSVPDHSLDSAAWQELMKHKPIWRIWSAEQPPAGAKGIEPKNGSIERMEHPVTRYLDMKDTHIAQLAEPIPGAPGKPLLVYGTVPALYAGMTDGKPGIVFAFDIRDSDLPLRPEFPILIAQAAEWMNSGLVSHLGQAAAGQQLEISMNPAASAAEWELVEAVPGWKGSEAAASAYPSDLQQDEDGALSTVQAAPRHPGLYRLVETGPGRETLGSRLLAVSADPAESRQASETGSMPGLVQPGPESPDAGADAGSEAEAGITGDEGGSSTGASGHEQTEAAESGSKLMLAPWIAALLLILMALEWGVYRRGSAV
ncbi:hypothetical protein DNH61_08495 [Paenibacillus sambharensis]|uniref:VWFA domain-containing protein n=1 Tax=Paenibacillus sambharensis TaxID=1803190 RepID=A0A2W1LAI7_9BACL|nr:VWA domain-containing protein [Paenibacillus sambharensis]PZD96236.1 hypothetical protein DNH61_08495 [Paenibacillus sambharensis]